MRLTRRGERLVGVAVVLGLFFALWFASALGYWITGVPG